MPKTSELPPTSKVTDLYQAIRESDLATLLDLVAPGVILHMPGTHSLAGTHRGSDAVLTCMAEMTGLTDGGEHIEVLDVLGGHSYAAAYCHVTATRDGRPPLDNHTVHLLRFDDAQLVEIWFHNRNDFDVNEFWS
jgi:uncharacterized protein